MVYPPPYVWEAWRYKYANTELIRQATNKFNWQRVFLNTNTNEKVGIFDSTILNIRSNLIPHEFDDKDPPWFNKKIALSWEKDAAFKNYNNSSNIDLKCHLKYLQACLNASIEVAKEKYQYISKLYRSLLKLF